MDVSESSVISYKIYLARAKFVIKRNHAIALSDEDFCLQSLASDEGSCRSDTMTNP